MANLTRNFTLGKMNKMVDERLIPNGEYVDALNIRMGSTEGAEIGVIENSKGNLVVTNLQVDGIELSSSAKCIGAFEDGAFETIYWMVHDPAFTDSNTGKLDLIVSWNSNNGIVVYHIISKDDGGGINTTLNFNDKYLFTGIDKIENLFFFTDNLNPPRKINTIKNYADPLPSGVDGFLYNDILVIKQPPLAAPKLELLNTGTQENFLEERFICFGYRYKYEDDEYSATSQFTSPAFSPKDYLLSTDSYLNEGMTNFYNTVEITFNTGGPLIIGVDLLFKEASSSVIKVIEKLDKNEQGYSDYQDVVYSFSNSKIFTILPEAEILRLYDNVPLLAKAETLMGNRIMYGNYVEGYDLITKDFNPVRLDYTIEKKSESFDEIEIDSDTENLTYSIGHISEFVLDSGLSIDLSNVEFIPGAVIEIQISFTHNSFSFPTGVAPSQTNGTQNFTFRFDILDTYNSVYEWASSPITTGQVGTSLPGGNIEPIATRTNGSTMTDRFNRLFYEYLDTLQIYQSGITAAEQAIDMVALPGINTIWLWFPAIQYEDPAIPQTVTEYFKISSANVSYSKVASGPSLHSNRGYEVGIIYMDEFNRSTPALVSQYNTAQFICDDSDTLNSVIANIPTSQVAPFWAANYKFVIKPDRESYETIFSNVFFTDPSTRITYFLLQGESAAKVTKGQRLVVKRDSGGPTSDCEYATVLDKEAQQENFIDIALINNPSLNVKIPAGVYMEIKASSFNVSQSQNAIIDYGCKEYYRGGSYGKVPRIFYPVGLETPDPAIAGSEWIDYDLPAGSRVTFKIRQKTGKGDEERLWKLEPTTAYVSKDYDNFFEWFEGDNIISVLELGQYLHGTTYLCNPNGIEIKYLGMYTTLPEYGVNITSSYCFIQCGFYRTPENELQFWFFSPVGIPGTKVNAIKVCISVMRAENTCIFESEPLDSAPDVWYEGSETFGIVKEDDICDFTVVNDDGNDVVFNYLDSNNLPQQIIVEGQRNGVATTVNFTGKCGTAVISASTPPITPANVVLTWVSIPSGTHLGNVQNQIFSTSQPAICDTGLFNCYSFGNGVESYKIRDSVIGKDFNLGNRVTTTQALDYSRVVRGADITYSGVYNDESNINRLNEFNAGLLNFKALEESFGPIQKLFARETDVLTLQEDKISYVLAGKNLLSDAGAGNLLTTVPMVLGTQVARIEEFGISHNPESFAQWGPDKYFTDAKRGAVLKLSGTSAQNDSLETVSGYGMRTWFRDLFNTQFETQKLGGFDPYMNEYVITSNQELIPVDKTCVSCGVSQQIIVTRENGFDACFEMGDTVGPVEITWDVASVVGTFDVIATYGGVTVSALLQTGSGSLIVNKNVISLTEINVAITSDDAVTLTINVPCPDSESITVIEVVATTANEASLNIHTQFRYIDGSFVSPLTSNFVNFNLGTTNPIVSYYNSVIGQQGQGAIPTTGSTVFMAWNKIIGGTAVWENSSNKFRWFRSPINYANTPQSIANLITASNALVTDTSQQPNYYASGFTMPSGNTGDYLYLIWDLRKPTLIDLCASTTLENSCCLCY